VQTPYAQAAETHSAVVFFVGDRAYKLKKPVDLGFLDFRTPQDRAAACAREVELNRRYAPDCTWVSPRSATRTATFVITWW
jgi:uncharacterized protein